MIHGYGVDVDFDGELLTVHGRSRAARVALRGIDHTDGDLVVPAADITAADLRPAGVLTNGRLTVSTDGGVFVLHFLRKQAGDFETLHTALQAVLSTDTGSDHGGDHV